MKQSKKGDAGTVQSLNPMIEAISTRRIANAILQAGVDFTIRIDDPGSEGSEPGIIERKFKIYPIKLGTLLQISGLLSDIDIEDFKKLQTDDSKKIRAGELFKCSLDFIVKYTDTVIQSIGYAILNNGQEPDDDLLSLLKDNLSTPELFQLFELVVNQMRVEDFLACMVLVTKMTIINDQAIAETMTQVSN